MIMSNRDIRRKENTVSKFYLLVIFGIAIQTTLLFYPVMQTLDPSSGVTSLTTQFIVSYLFISFIFCTTASLYINPPTVISPYYTQIGSTSFIVFLVFVHFASSSPTSPVFASFVTTLLPEFAFFVLSGLGVSIFLRKMIGVNAEPDFVWSETYKIEAEFDLVKSVLDAKFFQRYNIDDSEKDIIIATRKSLDITSCIVLQKNIQSPDETLLSISTAEIKFESMWKTNEAKDVLVSIKQLIIGILYDKYKCELIEAKDDRSASSKSVYSLIETTQSPLTKLKTIPQKYIISLVSLLIAGSVVSIFYFIQPQTDPKWITIDTLVVTWVTVVSTMFYTSIVQIKTQLLRR